jgi:hypothetical protein
VIFHFAPSIDLDEGILSSIRVAKAGFIVTSYYKA